MRSLITRSYTAFGILLFIAASSRADFVWIEGEKPTKSNFQKHNWYDAVKKDALSGGEWLSHYGNQPGEASYAFKIEEAGEYTFWVRCNKSLVTQHYNVDGGEWIACDLESDAREEMILSEKPDHRFLAWCKLGKIKLSAGEHTVGFRLTSKISNHGGIDCLVLTNKPFSPSGARKPGPDKPAGPADWFVVQADDDSFSPDSIIDMTRLLHQPAGKLGFVTAKDERLTLGGKPVKFWGCGANYDAGKSQAWHEQWVRYLAKHGVNMVRQHTLESHLGPLVRDPKTGERGFDPKKLDQWDWWHATLKKQGIYSTWSLFYPHIITREDGYDLFDDLPMVDNDPNRRSTSGLVNVEPALQAAQWEYAKAILTHKNPYTGLRYVDDPALAVVEAHNEDCIFWHAPLNDLAGDKKFTKHAERLKAHWAEWLAKQYKSDNELKKAWGEGMRNGDSLKNTKMEIYAAWEMGADGPSRQDPRKTERRRLGDFIRFCAETQREFYARREKQLRELGYKAVTVSTAWRGGPAADPANLWCDDAMTMIDRHNYFGGGDGGHGISLGKVNNDSHLGTPGGGLLSLGMYQLEHKPFSVTEWTSLPPNQWKAEAAPLVAFYGFGLQGWDASYHFLSSRNQIGGGWPNLNSYVTDTPHYIGQFPALALALAEDHIAEAPAAARRLKPDQLFAGIDPLQQDFSGGGYDAKQLKGNLATPTEALAIGRVTVDFNKAAKPSKKVDWAKSWDKKTKVITSLTKELVWDYGHRFVLVKSPKTQGIIGFAGETTQELPAARVKVTTPFVSLILTALDNRPLDKSKHLLITAMAQDRQTGTEYSADGKTLTKLGGPPLEMEPVQAEITLLGDKVSQVRAVDFYGVPTDQKLPVNDNTFSIDGRYRAYYYEVKR